ncbi:putative two-component system sensor kinase [Patulibacter medicamentivorans]|uniref:Putative two-component system sensor kinase n=2 Tax=Patulibacter medicamentivorans TaxID=1097667 RepID=H0E2E8_9ACTN|nr:putative two-component system sensor kinase [Patulibacter medicamentivorans]
MRMPWTMSATPARAASPIAAAPVAPLDELAQLEADEARAYPRRRRILMSWVAVVLLLIGIPQAADGFGDLATASAILRVSLNVAVIGSVLWLLWSGFVSPDGEPRWPQPSVVTVLLVSGGLLASIEDEALIVPMGIAMAAGTRLPPRVALGVVVACTGLTFAQYAGDFGNGFGAALGVVGSGVGTVLGRRQSLLVHEARSQRLALARGAVADERLRIGRDMHDLLGHTLLAITVKSELARQLVHADPDRATQEIAEVEQTARRALAEVRETVAGYRAPRLIEEVDAATRVARAGGVAVVADVADLEGLPRDVEAALGWAVREGVSNALRHAAARRIHVRVAVGDREAALEVVDDGRGPTADAAPGSGLAGLRERIAALDGAVTTGVGTTGGFRLVVRVPLLPGGPDRGPDDGTGDGGAREPARRDLAGRLPAAVRRVRPTTIQTDPCA